MISTSYAMAPSTGTQGPAAPAQGLGASLVPVLVIFAIFYFLIIRPQKKRDGEHKKFLEGLKKGDEVYTQAGMYGKIAGLEDAVATLEIAPNVKIRVGRSSILGLAAQGAEKA